jgi:hypothetical protein
MERMRIWRKKKAVQEVDRFRVPEHHHLSTEDTTSKNFITPKLHIYRNQVHRVSPWSHDFTTPIISSVGICEFWEFTVAKTTGISVWFIGLYEIKMVLIIAHAFEL